ncbi:MAG: hydrogenase maturation protease [Coriobacteriia bacterium]
MTAKAVILAIGNTFMGDDGVGAAVARVLASRGALPDGVEIVVSTNAEMGLLQYFLGSPVIVIDALDAEAEPGAVFRFRPDDVGLTTMRTNNIHGMGVGSLIFNARMAGVEPDVIVYGVQVGDVRPNPDTLSAPVAAVVDAVADMVEGEAARVCAGERLCSGLYFVKLCR